MKELIILFLMLNTLSLFSQENQEIKVNTNFSLKSQYYYDTFIPGKIYFKDGREAHGELNYNVVVEEFHYIENDILRTFSEMDIRKISKIVINNKLFIVKNLKVYEVIYSDKIMLLLRRKAEKKDVNQNTGAYGTNSNTSTNQKITVLSHAIGHELEKGALVNIKDEINNSEINLVESFNLLYNNKLYPTNKKSFIEIYPDKEDEIKSYIKKEKIKLKKPEDIIKLIVHCINFEIKG